MSDKKTETGQYVAQGDHDPADHAKNVEDEAKAHGLGHVLSDHVIQKGAGQGGN